MRPLDGLRVLDFTTAIPGPLATLVLADAGAEVVKVERLDTGDELRLQIFAGNATTFTLLNRGKKSVAADLKNDRDRQQIFALAAEADILVEQFRPGVMDRLGLGYRAIKAVNNGIIYCSISGFGQDGLLRNRAGHDMNYLAQSGLLSLSAGAPGHRTLPPTLIADIAGGSYPALTSILLAVLQRQRSGDGCHLDISMTDNLFALMPSALAEGVAAGRWPSNGDRLATGASPRYRLYETSDGRMLAAAPIEPKFWATFANAIGLEPHYSEDAADPAGTIRRIQQIIGSRDAAHWEAVFAAADCCCSIVRSVEEAVEQSSERDAVRSQILPLPIAKALRSCRAPASPGLGEHNGEFGLGWD